MRYRYSAGKDGKPEKKAIIYTHDEHGIKFADVDVEAVSIVRKLKSSGYDSYIVGGAVRDLILGKKPKDFDIVSAASPTKLKKIFHNSRIIGRRFRLVHVYFGQKIYEVATFRSLKDGNTSNTFGTIDEDAFRRDFTMNSLYYDPVKQVVVDYTGGMEDIKNKLVKPIISISEIFKDDPVRMIRAVKYAAMTDFSLPVKLKWKIKSQSNLLTSISPSRLTEEIFKIINSGKTSAIVDLLDKMGLYSYLQPKAAELMRKNAGFRQKYLESLTALNGVEKYHGQALGALFYDYLESIRSWESGVIEDYKEVFNMARSFVIPMNPPRSEMEHALRKFLSNHGITRRPHPKPALESGAKPAKRKRRRKPKPKPAGAPVTP